MAIIADIRFDSRPSNRVEQFWRDADVIAFAHFRDAQTNAYVAVSGVSAVAYVPGGTELSPAPTVAEVSDGIWSVTISAAAAVYSGQWRIQANCTSPSAAVAVRDFTLSDPEPDENAPPNVSYYSAVALTERAEAAARAAEAAQSSNSGPLYATSVVAETLDSNGRCTNYTCVLPRAITTGSVVKIEFPTRSGAAPVTIRPTVSGVLQSFVGLRENDGTQITDGFFAEGVIHSFVFDGTTLNAEGRAITTEIVQPTGHQHNYRAPGDAHPRHRDWPLEDGRRFWYSGDGTVAPTIRFGILEDGSVRAYSGMRIDGTATIGTKKILTEGGATALIAENIKHIVGAPSRMNNRTAPQRISVASYYQVSGLDQHRHIVFANGAMINFVHAAKGAEYHLEPASSGAVCHIYTGEGTWTGDGVTAATLTAHSWVNDGSKMLTSSAGAWLRVRRANTTFLAIADHGTIGTASGATMAAADLVLGVGPQSWGVDLQNNGPPGAVEQLGLLGLGTKFHSVPTAAVGASSLLYFAAKSTLFYWDQRTDTPGQRLIDMAEAIKADRTTRTSLQGSTAPAMSVMVWFEGLNLMGEWGPSSTHADNNPAVYTASMVKAFQWLNADLGYNLTYIVIPLTSQKLGTFSEDKWHAVRMAQLRAPAAGAAASPSVSIVIAPDVYGDPRSGDEEAETGERHYDFPVHAVQMQRIIDAWGNATLAQTNHLGPVITGVSTADSGAGIEWDVTIDYGTGRQINQSPAPYLAGFRMLPVGTGNIDTDDFATPLEIASTRWVAATAPTIKLRVTLAAAYLAGTPRPSVLWGSAQATDDLDTLIYTLHPVNGKRMYLRQYLSGG